MTRRNAFDRIRKDAQDPITSIPLAKVKKRDNRAWDRKHPVVSYYIPAPLKEKARKISVRVLALSQEHMTSISSVAAALASYSLSHVRQGRLRIEGRPDANRRKMILAWEEVHDGWPQEIPQPIKRNGKSREKAFYLGYRWSRDIDSQIKSLADTSISAGEVVVFLLRYAIDALDRGRLRLKDETVVVSQKVSPIW
jgi:hypothetical protein